MKKQKKVITSKEIRQALQRFYERGGLVTRLPDQVAPTNTMVGTRWGTFEEMPVALSAVAEREVRGNGAAKSGESSTE